jgi:hypothetical protein
VSATGKRKRGPWVTAFHNAELQRGYHFCLLLQPIWRKTPVCKCVACDAKVTNQNLGGHSGRSALTGALWCDRCVDLPPQLVFNFSERVRHE